MRESGPLRVDKLHFVDRLGELKDRAIALFRQRFGDDPELLAAAPGRVNLIGEHTDYNEGFVFPAAIDRRVVVAVSTSPDASKAWSEGYETPAVFDVETVSTVAGWARFPAGCAWILAKHGHDVSNINAAVVNDLPTGSGLSSSAAMELAFLTAWNALDELGHDASTLALYGQQCEHEHVGVHCGVMDQMASALGKEGCAMLLDTRSLAIDYAPIPSGLDIVVCDTNRARSLAASSYNERRRQCQEAALELGVSSLRDATLESLHGTYPDGGGVKERRARHVITENERCAQFAKALSEKDTGSLGRLMKESHLSLKDDYEVSCQELDWMAESAWASPGCVGARMTGAGFGGACVALVESDQVQEFVTETGRRYLDLARGLEPNFLLCRASEGAGTL